MNVLSRLLARGEQPDTGDLQIVPMHRRHLREVVPIEASAYPAPWSRSVFESELHQVGNGSREYIVARREGRVVGYAGLWFVDDPDGAQAHVTNIVVAADVRASGIGTRLMSALAHVAIERGCSAWTLEVRASNAAAQSMYRRFGFVPAGVRKRYYENVEDAIVMWCHDIQSEAYRERLTEIAGRRGMPGEQPIDVDSTSAPDRRHDEEDA